MDHRFLTNAEIDLLLDPSRWRVAFPGQPTADKAPHLGDGEAAWRRRSRHAHDHPELLVVLRGGGGFALGDTLIDARSGLVALVPPGLRHDDGLPPGSTACHLWMVWLDDRVLVVLAEGSGRRIRPVQSLLAVECGPDPAKLMRALATGDPAAQRRLHSALVLTLAQVVELGWRPAPVAGQVRGAVLDAMRRHLESSGGAGASLYTLAQQARVSRGYFARAFRQTTGSSVGGFINLCRLRRAEVLRVAGHTEAEIAIALGFANPQSWSRWRRRKAPPKSPQAQIL